MWVRYARRRACRRSSGARRRASRRRCCRACSWRTRAARRASCSRIPRTAWQHSTCCANCSTSACRYARRNVRSKAQYSTVRVYSSPSSVIPVHTGTLMVCRIPSSSRAFSVVSPPPFHSSALTHHLLCRSHRRYVYYTPVLEAPSLTRVARLKMLKVHMSYLQIHVNVCTFVKCL